MVRFADGEVLSPFLQETNILMSNRATTHWILAIIFMMFLLVSVHNTGVEARSLLNCTESFTNTILNRQTTLLIDKRHVASG